MTYDKEFGEKYAEENDGKFNQEFSKFIHNLAISLHANSFLEVGCSTGNDLIAFPQDYSVNGIDLNELAISKAKQNFPSFNFKAGSITDIPFEDASIDLVFTHKVLNYLDDQDLKKAISELFRVSKRYVVNCELFSENEEKISEIKNHQFRNIYKKWLDYKVKIISNVNMHEDYDSEQSRFTLVKKL